jgi:GTP-binding protein EngB required for normal cell division
VNFILVLKKNISLIVIFIDKNTAFNDTDEEIMSLFTSVASKVIVNNFKQMDETDLSKLAILNNFKISGRIYLQS